MRLNDIYDISISGDITNIKTGRILKPCLVGSRGAYKALRLGVGKKYYVHHLVASKFLPAPSEADCVIDHIDRDRLNNHASNLRWVSYKVNSNNKNFECKARTNNKLGECYISGYNKKYFKVQIRTKGIDHSSIHETLTEAVKTRDTILEACLGK